MGAAVGHGPAQLRLQGSLPPDGDEPPGRLFPTGPGAEIRRLPFRSARLASERGGVHPADQPVFRFEAPAELWANRQHRHRPVPDAGVARSDDVLVRRQGGGRLPRQHAAESGPQVGEDRPVRRGARIHLAQRPHRGHRGLLSVAHQRPVDVAADPNHDRLRVDLAEHRGDAQQRHRGGPLGIAPQGLARARVEHPGHVGQEPESDREPVERPAGRRRQRVVRRFSHPGLLRLQIRRHLAAPGLSRGEEIQAGPRPDPGRGRQRRRPDQPGRQGHSR